MTINVISVKWGDKYNSSQVNRLYNQIQNNLTLPYKFYCLTDDPVGLDSRIIPVDIVDELDGVWNKLVLFKNGLFAGTCLYFDIDVIIQHPIDSLLNDLSTNLTLIRCYWKEGGMRVTYGDHPRLKDRWDMSNNSSTMLWTADSQSHIWEHFQTDADYFMIKYRGIDRFLYHEGFELNYFERGVFYSRLYGYYNDLIDSEWTSTMSYYKTPDGGRKGLHYVKDALVCLLNGDTQEWMYDIKSLQKCPQTSHSTFLHSE